MTKKEKIIEMLGMHGCDSKLVNKFNKNLKSYHVKALYNIFHEHYNEINVHDTMLELMTYTNEYIRQ